MWLQIWLGVEIAVLVVLSDKILMARVGEVLVNVGLWSMRMVQCRLGSVSLSHSWLVVLLLVS